MHTIRIALCTFLFFTSMAAASADFPASRYPFQPKLVVNNNSNLCNVLLKDIVQQFFTDKLAVNHTTDNHDGIEWLVWGQPEDLQVGRNHVGRLDLDLDGNGKTQVVLMHYFEHSWRGDNYYAFVFPSVAAVKKLTSASPENLLKVLWARWGRSPIYFEYRARNARGLALTHLSQAAFSMKST